MPGAGNKVWQREVNVFVMDRARHLESIGNETFDLCIIGGGASGAGSALDAALRGLKVVLVEQDDFAAETSSKSTKLIHGGVRYLEQAFKNLDFGQLRQVRHGLEERHIVLHNAPHLAHELALITPVSTWLEGLYFSIGLKLYDWFASGSDTLQGSRWLSKADTLARVPGLNRNIHSAVLYYDGQLDDARYCLALVQSAAEAGAIVVNHAQVVEFEKDLSGGLQAAVVRDTLSNGQVRIRSKVFLNCTGPHADRIRMLANPALTARIRPSKGVHVVLPLDVLGSRDALLIPKTKDGRVVFAIPFEGMLLLGTTDNDFPNPTNEPVLETTEVEFLLETLQPFVSKPLDRKLVRSGFGGLRPLIAAVNKQTKTLLRDHEVERDTESGLFSLLGGKWTTYRLMAKDAIDAICRQLGVEKACLTGSHLLAGAEDFDYDRIKKQLTDQGLNDDISQHLTLKYGSRAIRVSAIGQQQPELLEPVLPDMPFIKAEVVYAARHEMACTVRDFLARRIRLEISDWQAAMAAAPVVSDLMGDELGWTGQEKTENAAAYMELIRTFIQRSQA